MVVPLLFIVKYFDRLDYYMEKTSRFFLVHSHRYAFCGVILLQCSMFSLQSFVVLVADSVYGQASWVLMFLTVTVPCHTARQLRKESVLVHLAIPDSPLHQQQIDRKN